MKSNTKNRFVIAPAAGGIFFPAAGQLGRSPRETVTPLVQQKVVWAGATLGSYQQATEAIKELAGIDLVTKQVRRITSQIGNDRVQERCLLVNLYQQQPLLDRLTAAPGVNVPELAVVMMDGGRYQRRDGFRDRNAGSTPEERCSATDVPGKDPGVAPAAANVSANEKRRKTHWHEDILGLVLSMNSEVFDHDPSPQFPEWLASAPVVAELAKLTERDEQNVDVDRCAPAADSPIPAPCQDWQDLAPKLLTRDVIASSQDAEAFGWHLEHLAWTRGTPTAKRQAFVADGLAVNWTIHRKHFSQMTGILDLMHGLSYSWRAAEALNDPAAYRRFAEWIWQGQVQNLIQELEQHQERVGPPDKKRGDAAPCNRIREAITYYENHQQWMNYPEYRKNGLPLTSSHVESTMKQLNARVKGTEKFWCTDTGDAVLQLRADTLSDSKPLPAFWSRWQNRQTGANKYRKVAA